MLLISQVGFLLNLDTFLEIPRQLAEFPLSKFKKTFYQVLNLNLNSAADEGRDFFTSRQKFWKKVIFCSFSWIGGSFVGWSLFSVLKPIKKRCGHILLKFLFFEFDLVIIDRVLFIRQCIFFDLIVQVLVEQYIRMFWLVSSIFFILVFEEYASFFRCINTEIGESFLRLYQ